MVWARDELMRTRSAAAGLSSPWTSIVISSASR